MQREPPPFVWAAPDEKNILTCQSTRIQHMQCLTLPCRELPYRASYQHMFAIHL